MNGENFAVKHTLKLAQTTLIGWPKQSLSYHRCTCQLKHITYLGGGSFF